jgi:hypothetical protein
MSVLLPCRDKLYYANNVAGGFDMSISHLTNPGVGPGQPVDNMRIIAFK